MPVWSHLRAFPIVAATLLAACGGTGHAGKPTVAEPAEAGAPPPAGIWTARAAEGICVLEAAITAGKVQFVVRPATVAIAMGRFDQGGPRLDASSTAELAFAGTGGRWSLTAPPFAPNGFGRSVPRKDGGLDLVQAALAGGEFRSLQLDLTIHMPPAVQMGEAFNRCVAALPAAPPPEASRR